MSLIEKMKLLASSLEASYARMNERIEELEREITETGLNVGEVFLPLQSMESTFLTWAKRSVDGGPRMWRLCIVETLPDGTENEITVLASAPREARLEAIHRIDEFHQRMVDAAEKLHKEINEAIE